jgi:hypothetical protein
VTQIDCDKEKYVKMRESKTNLRRSYAIQWLAVLPLEIVAVSITSSFWSGEGFLADRYGRKKLYGLELIFMMVWSVCLVHHFHTDLSSGATSTGIWQHIIASWAISALMAILLLQIISESPRFTPEIDHLEALMLRCVRKNFWYVQENDDHDTIDDQIMALVSSPAKHVERSRKISFILLGSLICWVLLDTAFFGLGFNQPRVTAMSWLPTIVAKFGTASHVPDWAIQLGMQIIITNLAQIFGPISQMTLNSKFFSGQAPRRLNRNNGYLPHITIQMPVYKEGLVTVIQPTIISLKAAISTYELQGGTANIFVNDDCMQLIPEEEAQARRDFYEEHNIGWVARPKHNPKPEGEEKSFVRKGKFKKAPNIAIFPSIAIISLGSLLGTVLSIILADHMPRKAWFISSVFALAISFIRYLQFNDPKSNDIRPGHDIKRPNNATTIQDSYF